MKNGIPFLLIILMAMVSSCSDDDSSSSPTGLIYSYFPVNVGHEVIYDVTVITKDEFTFEEDTALYQVKEVVESEFIDDQGRTTQRLERYTRDTPNDAWVISDVWTSNRTNTRVEKKEENLSYVKMVFPINGNVTWNGNLLNTLDPQTYEYMDLHLADVIGGINFDSTLTVLQNDDDNFIYSKYEIEKFAPDVGRIYKVHNEIYKDNSQPGVVKVLWQKLYKETIVSWSN